MSATRFIKIPPALRRRRQNELRVPDGVEPEFVALYKRAAPYTMTSAERMYAVWQSVRYIASRGVAGDIVECGVWRGGSSLLAALALQQAGDTSRTLHLYDTFEGMPAPGERDIDQQGTPASARLAESRRVASEENVWCYATLEDVQTVMAIANYPRVEYVPGRVEDTIPDQAPDRIAVLRLDTDWYESTWHELEHLYPRLVRGGVLIIDDYGDWQGARAAVDEYFADKPVLLQRIDWTGRLAIRV